MDADEEFQESERWKKGPLVFIGAIALSLLFVLSIVPSYNVKVDSNPSAIPERVDVFFGRNNQTVYSLQSYSEISNYVDTGLSIKQTADTISVFGCGNDRVCQAKAQYLFVREKIIYTNDPLRHEFVKTPGYTLDVGAGDCDDHAVLLSSLLNSIGIQTRFIFVPSHVYIQAYLPESLDKYQDDEGWVNLDPTCKNCDFGDLAQTYDVNYIVN